MNEYEITNIIAFTSAATLLCISCFFPFLIIACFIFFFFFFFMSGLTYELGLSLLLHSQLITFLFCLVLILRFGISWNIDKIKNEIKQNKLIFHYFIVIVSLTVFYCIYNYVVWGMIPYYFLKLKLVSLWPFLFLLVPCEKWQTKKVIVSLLLLNFVVWLLTFPNAYSYFQDTIGNSLWRFWDEIVVVDVRNYVYVLNINNIRNYFFLLDESTGLIFSVVNIFMLCPALVWYFSNDLKKNFLSLLILFSLFLLIVVTQYFRSYVLFYFQIAIFLALYCMYNKKINSKKLSLLLFLILTSILLTEGRVTLKNTGYFDFLPDYQVSHNNYALGMFASRFCGFAGTLKEDCKYDLERNPNIGTRMMRNMHTLIRLWNERPLTGRGYPLDDSRTKFPSLDKGFIHAGGSEVMSNMVFWGIPFGIFYEFFYIFPFLIVLFSPTWKLSSMEGKFYLMTMTLSVELGRAWGILGINTAHNTILSLLFIVILKSFFQSNYPLRAE